MTGRKECRNGGSEEGKDGGMKGKILWEDRRGKIEMDDYGGSNGKGGKGVGRSD